MKSWNHRIIRTRDESGNELLEFAEVHYDEEANPIGYTSPFMCSETMPGLEKLLQQLEIAINLRILDESEIAVRTTIDILFDNLVGKSVEEQFTLIRNAAKQSPKITLDQRVQDWFIGKSDFVMRTFMGE